MRRTLLIVAIYCIAALLLPSAAAARKPIVILGRVTDTRSQPVAAALVAVPALSESTETDDRGLYHLTIVSKIRSGEKVVVVASREGYDYGRRSVTLVPGSPIRQNFRLVPNR